MDVISVAERFDHRDSAWQAWLERLRGGARTYDEREGPCHLYVVADSRGNPGFNKLLEQVPGLQWASLWRDSAIETYSDVAPYLFAIERGALDDARSLPHRLIRRIWREDPAHQMLTWMWSPFSIEVLGEHYRRYCTYALPDRRQFYLHFYDNRILARLREVWTPAEQAAFIGPCAEIWYTDRLLGDVTWTNESVVRTDASEAVPPLSSEQHHQLIELGYPDKLALHLRTTCGVRLDHLTPDQLYRSVSGLLERAGTYRIRLEGDLLTYVMCGVLSAPNFDEHPEIHDRLLAVARGETQLAEALGAVSDHVWDVIREESTNA